MNHKLFSKVFIGLTFFLLLFFVFNLGIDAAKGDGKEAVVDGVQAAFWLFAFVLFTKMNRETEKVDRELEESKAKLDKSLDDLLGTILDSHKNHKHRVNVGEPENAKHAKLSEDFDAIMDKVVGEGEPTDAQITEIVKQFTTKTGHEVKIERHPFGLSVRIAKDPIKKSPARKPATKKAPVKKPVTTPKKPVTKKGK